MHFKVPRADAEQAADVLAKSDLRGIDSHGVARLHTYFEMLELGRINPRPKTTGGSERRIVWDWGAVDAEACSGQGLESGAQCYRKSGRQLGRARDGRRG
jgi:LDH2 family malate/lactate/ureidoglycolate dehydrogenase